MTRKLLCVLFICLLAVAICGCKSKEQKELERKQAEEKLALEEAGKQALQYTDGAELNRIIHEVKRIKTAEIPLENTERECDSSDQGYGTVIASNMLEIPLSEKTDYSTYRYGRLLFYQTTLCIKPSFYPGPMPFVYIGGTSEIHMESGGAVLFYLFKEWKNIYSERYEFDGIPEWCYTISNDGLPLAKAKFIDRRDDQFEVVEVHYPAKRQEEISAVFKCVSAYNIFGNKIAEREVIGKKEKDYNFIWPSATIPGARGPGMPYSGGYPGGSGYMPGGGSGFSPYVGGGWR